MKLIKYLFKMYYTLKWGQSEAEWRFKRARYMFRGIKHFTKGGGLATTYNTKGERIRYSR
jgi:hypothetical protein